jgi:hypothetical protein
VVARRAEGALTKVEKALVKRLLLRGERNQDIQALLNIGRVATVNSARITEVKQDTSIVPAEDRDLDFYLLCQRSFDPVTGLNLYQDERLIRAREAMILAVQVFNSPSLKFKTEVFAVLANIAWTYLLHEYYDRKDVPIIEDGRSLLLSKMIAREDCPLSQGMKDNLSSMKIIRDEVEHLLLRRSDLKFMSIFQACCLNFDKKICELFGEGTTLKNDLSFSLQFAKLGFDQLKDLNDYEVPEQIEAIDKAIENGLGATRLADLEYRFRVVYTFENSTKSKAHIKFVHPSDEGADDIRNVLVKKEISDNLYPYKAGVARRLIEEQSGRKFTSHNHTQAWRKFDCRPRPTAKQPQNTNQEFCIYHSAHGDYTYSHRWVDFVASYISDEQNYKDLISYRL